MVIQAMHDFTSENTLGGNAPGQVGNGRARRPELGGGKCDRAIGADGPSETVTFTTLLKPTTRMTRVEQQLAAIFQILPLAVWPLLECRNTGANAPRVATSTPGGSPAVGAHKTW